MVSPPNLPGLSERTGENSVFFEQAMVPSALFKTGFEYAVYSGANNPVIEEMYSIALIDVTKAPDTFEIEDLDPHRVGGTSIEDKAEHFFRVPPKTVEFTEPYSSRIVATQNGGRFVESHGSLIRDVRIVGDSGLRPSKPLPASIELLGGLPLGPLAAPVNALAGPIINRADRLVDTATGLVGAVGASVGAGEPSRRLDPSERTGYDQIMKLRNIFRKYSDYKGDNDKASKIVMVWRDVKTADYWVVEPKEFKLVQDSKSPLTYNYVITLKTLTRFEFVFDRPVDPLEQIKASQNLIASIQTATKEVTNTLLVVSAQIDRLASVGVFAQNLIMTPIIDAVRGVSSVVTSVQGFTPTFRNNWDRLNNSLDNAIKHLESQLNTNISDPSSGLLTPITQALTQEEQEKSDSFSLVINSLRAAQRQTRRVLTLPGVGDSISDRVNGRKQRITDAYRKPLLGGNRQGRTPATAGDKSFLGNDRVGSSLARSCVEHGETIFSMAQRVLGNRNRWKMLVMVNDLKPPYTSTTGNSQTLAPGDCFLYPTNETTGLSLESITTDSLEKDQQGQNIDTQVELAYGRDIRLSSDSKNRTDFALNADGDLATIQGIPNVKQAVRLKFATEQGTLTVHPRYGTSFPLGKKMTNASFNSFRINSIGTLRSDPRITSIRRLDFYARGDILSIGAELVLKDTTDVTTTAFKPGSF